MNKKLIVLALTALVVSSVTLVGCKAKEAKPAGEEILMESTEMSIQPTATLSTQMTQPVVEPAQTVASETIPPTAAAQEAVARTVLPAPAPASDRNKDVQTALKNAGFYTGAVDGKIGPKSKQAIQEFQKAKGLKVDGKVGPKTWAELEKYLLKQ